LCNDEKALALACEILIGECERGNIHISDSTKMVLISKLRHEVKKKHEWESIWLVYLLQHIGCDIPEDLQNELWESNFELLKVMWIHEHSLEKGKLTECFKRSNSWILLYELSVKLGDIDIFFDKLGIDKNKNFYQILFDNKYSFYKEEKITEKEV